MTNKDKNNNRCGHRNNPWFIAVVFLCIAVLILSGIVFYVIKPHPNKIMIDRIFSDSANSERLHIICINEDITLKEIAAETNMSYEELYESMNIAPGTDPDTPICELFDDTHPAVRDNK